MRKGLFVFAVMLAITVPAWAYDTIVLVDEGFESGSLAGWTEVSNSPAGHPPKVFSAASPMEVTEVYANPAPPPEWSMQPSGIYATAVAPNGGTYAMGWSRLGPYQNQQYFWISKYFQLIPGTYKMTASWYATCFNQSTPEESWALGAKFLALVGADYDQYNVVNDPLSDPSSRRSSLWSQDSGGAWVNKYFIDHTMTTQDGRLEIRLAMHDKFDTESPLYEWAAFDDVYIELTPIELIPEPSSLFALLSGVAGMGALVIRKRR